MLKRQTPFARGAEEEEWDSYRIVVALVVVGKSAPLGSSVDNAITQNQSTLAANDISTGELFAEDRWIRSTVGADENLVQVLLVLLLLAEPSCSGSQVELRRHVCESAATSY
jgi:hypothetical protein